MIDTPTTKIRIVTAASLFDGHDAAINIMRRILQSKGAEIIHLGHNRSVHEIVETAIEEDVHAIAITSYQGGHLDARAKELIGLTCSLVLRCDDCVRYHLGKCREAGFTTNEIHEAMGVATLVGGTIVIPHLRRAFEFWEELRYV